MNSLDRISSNQKVRLVRESLDERQARMVRMSTSQREKLVRETQDVLKDRLRIISRCRSERLTIYRVSS